jgi:hypothetical protein
VKLSGEVKGGRLLLDQAALTIAIRDCEGKRVTVEIAPERPVRSLKQNAFYHACVVPVIAHILTEKLRETDPDAPEVTNEEAHQALKRDVLGKVIVGGLELVRSTTKLSTVGFSDFTERGRQIAAEAGYYIADPGEPDSALMESA